MRSINITVGIISLGIWLFALAFPAIYVCNGHTQFGYELLMIGWMGVAVNQYGWFANLPLIWMTVRFLAGSSPTPIPLIISTVCVAMSFRFVHIDGTNGPPYDVCAHGVGFYAWALLPVYFVLALTVRPFIKRSPA